MARKRQQRKRRRPKVVTAPPTEKRDDLKFIVYGEQMRQGNAWPDVEEGTTHTFITVQSNARQRAAGIAEILLDLTGPAKPANSIEVPGIAVPQILACLVRAATNAHKNGAFDLTPTGVELLARLEIAVAQGDAAHG